MRPKPTGAETVLAVDAGNTHTRFGLFVGEKLRAIRSFPTGAARGAEWGWKLAASGFLAGSAGKSLAGIAIASVVPRSTAGLAELARRILNVPVLVIRPGDRGFVSGLKLSLRHPEQLGADRLANAAAAFARYGGPIVAVDFGTATTYDVVSRRGVFLGGVIAPGAGLIRDALAEHAARLPRVDLSRPKRAIGQTTLECLRSGVYYSVIGQVRMMMQAIVSEHGKGIRTVATGGLAGRYGRHLPGLIEVRESLTLEGIALLYRLNGRRLRR